MSASGSTDDLADELRSLEESLWRPETRYDRAHVESIFAPGFTEHGRSGRVWTRVEAVAMPLGEIDIDLPLPDFAVRALGIDAVLVTYRSVITRAPGEVETSNRASVWVRTDVGWQLAFHQGTPVP